MCRLLILLALYLHMAFAHAADTYVPCASVPDTVQIATYRGSVVATAMSFFDPSTGITYPADVCGAVGASPLVQSPAVNCPISPDIGYCFQAGHACDMAYALVNIPVSTSTACATGYTKLTSITCVLDTFNALSPDKQAAIRVRMYPTQSAADAACARGMNAAAAGKSISEIAAAAMGNGTSCAAGQSYISSTAADGTITYKCINSNGTTASSSGVPASQCPAGQNYISAVDAAGITRSQCWGKDQNGNLVLMSQDGVLTPAGQAAASAVAASGSNSNSSASSSSAASSTPPTSATPNNMAASGVFYTPGTITGGKTLSDVANNFLTNLKHTSILDYLNGFFALGVSGNTCPTWDISIPVTDAGNWNFKFDFFCWPVMQRFFDVLGLMVLFFAGFRAFHIAFG